MKKLKIISIFLLILIFTSCKSDQKHKDNSDETLTKRVDSVFVLMTLREKIGQMNQYNGFWDVTGPTPENGDAQKKYQQLKEGLVGSMLNVRGVKNVRALQKIVVENTRLHIPLIIGFDVIHGYKTLSPIPLAEVASWDLDAIKKSAQVAADEASASGINWTFAPMVDITRDPRWGRIMEGAGEDPYLGGLVAKARVKGFQGSDLTANNTIAACAKHFAAYGFVEAGKEYNTVEISDNLLHNLVLPPFKAALDADVKTFMNAFNDFNGIPATGSEYLQRDLLKGEWGFKGFVVSDWASIGEMITHGFAKDGYEAAKLAVLAGSDMDMESNEYVNNLENLIKNGVVSESLINDAVKRILKVKFELGLFDDPYKYCDEKREKTVVGSVKNNEAVLDMARKSIVLLKNENQLLPLKKENLHIAVIGALAADTNSPLGSWRGAAADNTAISVLEGLKKYSGNKINYQKGADVSVGKTEFIQEVKINTTDKSGFASAIKIAKKADVVLMVLGEHAYQTGEARSRTSLDLPGVQQELLEAVYKVNKKVVLILMNGRPLTINWADKKVSAILETWQLGTQAGNAIAQVIYGDYNPSGKLPVTFPKNVGQIPIYYNHLNTGRPILSGSVFWSHYTDVDNDPLYPFGYGLSYTQFKYSNLSQSNNSFSKDGKITFNVTLTNIGRFDGEEVVQWYLQDLFGSLSRPVRELKGFNKVMLKAGESKNISFSVDKKTITFYTANKKWEAESGQFELYVGGSSKAKLGTSFSYQ